MYEEQFDRFGDPIERNILSKYDDEIEGSKKKSNFTIGESATQEWENKRKLLEVSF